MIATTDANGAVAGGSTSSANSAPSPILAIALGPNRGAPSLLVVSTESGAVYFKALPDFVRWEKQRQPSTLSQLVNSAPLQAVKGTLLQAQNWTQETAGVIAQNARSFADEAVSELKRVREECHCLLVVCSNSWRITVDAAQQLGQGRRQLFWRKQGDHWRGNCIYTN